MDLLILNSFSSTGKVRRERLNGRDYIVAPITALVQGVLKGSKGSLYYPSEEITQNVGQWHGVPLTLRHPFDLGQPVSANHPGILRRQGLGVFFNPRIYVENNLTKMRGDGWFDVLETKKKSPYIYNKLQRGEPIEVSTGLFTDNYEAPNGSIFNGKGYSHIATNYRADHLAILPDETGACSIKDGCGVLINQKGDKTMTHNCKCGGTCVPCKEKLAKQREEMINQLALNQGLKTDLLSQMTDEQLGTLVTNHNIAEAAKVGFRDGKKIYQFSMERGLFVRNAMAEEEMATEEENPEEEEIPSEDPIENEGEEFTEEDSGEECPSEEEEVENQKPPIKNKKSTKNCSGKSMDEEEPTDNSSRTAYWMQKATLVSNMTSHITDEKAKKQLVHRLSAKKLSELQDLQALTQPNQKKNRSFVGNGAGAVTQNNQGTLTLSDDILPLPSYNVE